jgi:formylglycine-generating enzyme required for sulfatase activity
MLKLSLTLWFALLSFLLVAQSNLDVADFRLLPNDMTARTLAPEYDANGELTAVIKVVTTAQDFDFEGGTLGIAKIKPQPGEYWVYVPAKARVMTLRHPKLGVLRSYAYPLPIEAGNVYEMRLVHGTVETIVREAEVLSEFVIITSDPSGADVYLNNEPVGKTPFQSEKPEGRYEWRVALDLYFPEAGVFELKAGNKEKIEVDLKPNFGSLEVVSQPEPGAEIAINGIKIGKTTPSTLDELPSGEHTLTLSHEWYETTTQKVNVAAGGSEKVSITMQPNFAELTVEAEQDEEVYINGNAQGNGRFNERLTPGVYRVEVRKEHHSPAQRTVTLARGDEEVLSLEPTPILSSLKVMSEPMEADIYLNGKKVGTTPQILRDLLVGEYELELRKNGYGKSRRTIEVKQGEITDVQIELTRERVPVYSAKDYEHELVFVEGGTFTMGCTSEQSDCEDDESPTHSVTVSSFLMGKYEVTQSQWRAVMGNNPSAFSGCDDCPVEKVSLHEVHAFIQKLNQQTGKNYRLPTEAEWEYAARGGNQSRGYKFSGGDDLNLVGWYSENSNDRTHPVGGKLANELGIYDMTGNVWEWCEDWYGEYSRSSQTNPEGPRRGSFRVLRGGSWIDDTWICRVSLRLCYDPDGRGSDYGFRLVLPVEE